MDRIKTDICILGAGSGGLSVAAGAVQMGARVVLLEGHRMGGDCLNYGCIPSKALIGEAKRSVAMAEPVAYDAAKDHVAEVIAAIEPHDSQERFEGLGVQVIREFGRFISKTEVQAGDTVIEARRFVIATGSSPLVPPIPGIEDVTVHTNETIFDLREKPEHLLIVGGGPIGMEMAQAHRRLGCKVTVIEGARALGKDDPEAAALVLEKMRAEGVEIVEEAQAETITPEGGVTVQTSKGAFTGSHLLIAVGRRVTLDKLDAEAGGIAVTKGGIKVDAGLRSVTNRRVYAIGDVAGGLQFTHVAGYHAGVVVRPIVLGLPAKARTDHLPWVTYSDPELAQVGLTEAAARKAHGARLEVVRAEFAGNDRAVASRSTTGFVKVMVVRGRPVGATMVGPQAGELIAIWAMAIANRMKMSAISATVLPYPTLAEINKRAAGAYFGPKLFESPLVKRVVGFVQRWLP